MNGDSSDWKAPAATTPADDDDDDDDDAETTISRRRRFWGGGCRSRGSRGMVQFAAGRKSGEKSLCFLVWA